MTVLVAAAAAAYVATLAVILPSIRVVGLLALLGWFMLPGVVLAWRLYGRERGGALAALMAGPLPGYVLSSLVLLALWTLGVRRFGWLMLAPGGAMLLSWPAGALAGGLTIPRLSRADIAGLAVVLLIVPAVVGLPYARVGARVPEGRAYRAYFTADFVWEMAVVSEVSKGEIPPRNPYYLHDALHYYWLMHLLPAAEHRSFARLIPLERQLLANAMVVGAAFIAFFYFFVRHFVDRPWAAALAVLGIVFCSSFEGTQQILLLTSRGAPLDALRNVNIDAVTGWPPIGGQRADGLQRLLLYQPQHQVGYTLGFAALLLLVEARDSSKAALVFLVGTFLAMSLLLSPVAAVMLGVAAAAYELWRLASERRWHRLVACAIAAGVPVAAALVLTGTLGYVDRTPGDHPLVVFGINRLSTRALGTVIFLGFGPVLIVGLFGLLAVLKRGAFVRFLPIWIVLGVAVAFYFLVDLPEHQSVYVAWRASHLGFIASGALCGFALQEWCARPGPARSVFTAVAVVVTLAALPMVVIDLYNTQDIWNRAMGPGFRWTVIVSPGEEQGLDWIKRSVPLTARVQVEPTVRGRDTWAYIPAFAERRMSAGLPIGMIPLRKYETASADVRTLYQSRSATDAYNRAASLCIDYLVVGPEERSAYPELQLLLDSSPELFAPAFRNDTVAIWAVSGSWNRCDH